MSGIAGILNVDGSPVDGRLLARMAEYLRFRGPDGQGLHAIANVGFVHTLLKVFDDSGAPGRDDQPFTFDGRRFIVADARVDARRELATALQARGQRIGVDAGDAELILRAYCTWGDDCVMHLVGDFSFAIWDGPGRRLFCARDHLGVKPFYYAQLGETVVFSNTLDCVRQHPAVSRALNDQAIADFLLFGGNQQADTTTFRDVMRLAPAHSVSWSPGSTTRRCYWTLPIDEPIAFKRADDYTERFTELLEAAVSDRLRTGRVAVFMSGGLDSPTLAAAAAGLQRNRGGAVHAMTSVYDRLIPDSERHYAGLVAKHLDIPIHYDVRDDETSIADWERVVVHTPEPIDNPPAFVAGTQFLEKMSTHARIFLYGEGPDNALRYEWRPYLSHLLDGRHVGPLLRALSSDLLMHPRVPLWSLIRQTAGARRQERRWRQRFPDWLNEEFARDCDCRGRWDAQQQAAPSSRHPLRPLGHGGFAAARWQPLFEVCDIQGALTGTEMRHPFLDVRLLRYLLALPAMPWCRNKLVIRRAMKHRLPRAVVRRKKTSLSLSPDFARVKTSGLPRMVPAPTLSRYVNAGKVLLAAGNVVELRAVLRPLGLNYWLQDLAGSGYQGESR
jgi:asparagine synthase (glutamine-hydrolysing)